MSWGRSFHLQPAESTYRIPLITSLSSHLGLPVLAGGGSNGLMRCHCLSVRSESYGFLFCVVIRAIKIILLANDLF